MTVQGRTSVYLIRHGEHALGEHVLAGRLNGVALTSCGREQARSVSSQSWVAQLSAVHSSPRRRTLETAGAIAHRAGLRVTVCESLDEVDFGKWSGRTFAELELEPAWREWNRHRATASTPSGEGMVDVLYRALRHLSYLRREWAGQHVAVVTHAEIIRAILLRMHRMRLDAWSEVDVPLASVHVVHLAGPRSRSSRLMAGATA